MSAAWPAPVVQDVKARAIGAHHLLVLDVQEHARVAEGAAPSQATVRSSTWMISGRESLSVPSGIGASFGSGCVSGRAEASGMIAMPRMRFNHARAPLCMALLACCLLTGCAGRTGAARPGGGAADGNRRLRS